LSTAVDLMTTTNGPASEAMIEAEVDAATDVTGFGLLGHLHKMLLASGVAATVDAAEVPLIPGVIDLARADVVPGGTQRNHAFVNPATDWGDLMRPEQLLLADAQTSGGLLIATRDPGRLAAALEERSVPWRAIGEIEDGVPGAVRIHGRL